MADRYERQRTLLTHALPAFPVHSFAYRGEGADHLAFTVNGEWLFRFAKGGDGAALAREARILRYVATQAPLPVPRPVYVRPEAGFMGYRVLPGTPLLAALGDFDRGNWPAFAATLGGFLRAINDAPPAPLADAIAEDTTALHDYLAEARVNFTAVRSLIPARYQEPIGTFLTAAPPNSQFTPVLAHNDLGIEHILVDVATRQITGIIDWGDAALADPAYDFGKLYRDLGPQLLDALLDAYNAGGERAAIRERARFYGRGGARRSRLRAQDRARGLRRQRPRRPGLALHPARALVARRQPPGLGNRPVRGDDPPLGEARGVGQPVQQA